MRSGSARRSACRTPSGSWRLPRSCSPRPTSSPRTSSCAGHRSLLRSRSCSSVGGCWPGEIRRRQGPATRPIDDRAQQHPHLTRPCAPARRPTTMPMRIRTVPSRRSRGAACSCSDSPAGSSHPTSALLILLGAIAAGRPTFGLVLVVAFGVGMAAVMSGIGLVLVTARDRVDPGQAGFGFARVREAIPLVASVVVLGFGVVLTGQALSAIRPLGHLGLRRIRTGRRLVRLRGASPAQLADVVEHDHEGANAATAAIRSRTDPPR